MCWLACFVFSYKWSVLPTLFYDDGCLCLLKQYFRALPKIDSILSYSFRDHCHHIAQMSRIVLNRSLDILCISWTVESMTEWCNGNYSCVLYVCVLVPNFRRRCNMSTALLSWRVPFQQNTCLYPMKWYSKLLQLSEYLFSNFIFSDRTVSFTAVKHFNSINVGVARND